MSFVSLEFIALFCSVAALYFLCPPRFRWLVLLAGSIAYYAFANLYHLPILLMSVLIDFALARAIASSEATLRRKTLFIISLVHNVGLLCFFKFGLAIGSQRPLFLDEQQSVILPLGVSFYTFIKIGYLADVYQRKIPVETQLGRFATFATFFLTITSGPIERANHLLPQLDTAAKLDDGRITEGLRRVLWGVFKKVIIADTLAIYVNAVFDQPGLYSGFVLIFASVLLAFQIYADFAGYTDIVLGLAQILGIELFENFKQPYFATSILDFWRRWHISLTNWIRDYLFFPLSRLLLSQTKRRISSQWVQAITYLITMGLVGLWHGAAWTFLIWGILHGLFMGIEMLLPPRYRQAPQTIRSGLLRGLITFVLVDFAWVWFRAGSIGDAWNVISRSFIFDAASFDLAAPVITRPHMIPLSLLLIGVLIAYEVVDARIGISNLIHRSPLLLRWTAYYAAFIPIFLTLNAQSGIQDFIYFRF
jgi:alginate O-acetyltransferase complex protein AlgI